MKIALIILPSIVYSAVYVSALLGDASYLNPILATDSASGAINGLIYNGLVKYDKDIRIVPELASSWKILEGGRVIIFKLRKGVRWHDGKPFTAEDVEFTYKKLIDPNVKTPYASDFLLIRKLVVIDPFTVKVVYKYPFAPALESWTMGIIPKHIFQNGDFNTHPNNRKPIGTGPFKFVEWKTDQKIVLVAYDDYFEGRPKIDKVIYRIIPSQSVQFLELLNQSIDSMGLTPDQYLAYKEFFRHYNKFRYPSFSYTYLGFNLNHHLFKNKNIRKAIALAIDKKQIIKGVLLGMGRNATGPFPPQSWAYNRKLKDHPYDIEVAKRLLKKEGFEDRDGDGYLEKNGKMFSFTILTNLGNKLRELTGQIIQSQLKKIGIKVNLRIVEWSTFIHNFIDKRDFEAVILGWALGRDPDQFIIWHSSQIGEGKYNFVGYKNEEVDRLLEEGRRTFDFERRKKIYQEIHRIIHDDIPYVFLYYPEALPVVHKRFIGPKVAPLGIGWNFIEWYVPKGKELYKR